MNAGIDDPEQTRVVLEERARRLAQPLAAGAGTHDRVELLLFEIGAERYAIETSVVHAVASVARVAAVPGVPAHFAGVTMLRGAVVPLIDLVRLLDPSLRPNTGPMPQSAIVIGGDQPALGILVDAVTEIGAISSTTLASGGNGSSQALWVRGILPDARLLLDGKALLAEPRLTIGESEPRARPLEND